MAKILTKISKAVDYSFIIIPFNRPRLLRRCLSSIAKIRNVSYEVILVNNGNPIEEKIVKTRSNILVINNSKNVGIAKARNIGIKNSSGKYLVFLDDDAYLKNPQKLIFMKKYFETNLKAAIISPKIIYPSGKIQESIRRFPTLVALVLRGFGNSVTNRDYQKYIYKDKNRNEIFEVDWAIGACLIVRRYIAKKIGGFTDSYSYGYDDADFCRKIKRLGFKTIYNPMIEVVHNYQRLSTVGLFTVYRLKHVMGIIRFLLT